MPALPTPAQISSRESIKGLVRRVSRPVPAPPPRETGLPLWLFVALAALIVGVAAAFIVGR